MTTIIFAGGLTGGRWLCCTRTDCLRGSVRVQDRIKKKQIRGKEKECEKKEDDVRVQGPDVLSKKSLRLPVMVIKMDPAENVEPATACQWCTLLSLSQEKQFFLVTFTYFDCGLPCKAPVVAADGAEAAELRGTRHPDEIKEERVPSQRLWLRPRGPPRYRGPLRSHCFDIFICM